MGQVRSSCRVPREEPGEYSVTSLTWRAAWLEFHQLDLSLLLARLRTIFVDVDYMQCCSFVVHARTASLATNGSLVRV